MSITVKNVSELEIDNSRRNSDDLVLRRKMLLTTAEKGVRWAYEMIEANDVYVNNLGACGGCGGCRGYADKQVFRK